ncbi:MAG: hypothetical protein INR71_05775, partial [Terriglobus roseus]|nr:hypothetical protein [Terriglobus roseus]
ANFEFFSSMVRTFRVSVSDRYPPKPGQWIELGTFEARNSRDIQAFLVEGPRVWARYLRVEFVTHYGNEYYCPVSLLRVHGITMMEEYKHEEERARGDTAGEEEVIEEAAGGPEDIVTAEAIAVQGAAPIKASQDAPPSGASVAGHPPDAHVKHESEVSPSGETLAVANAHLNDPGKGSLSSGGSAAGKKVSLPTGETLLDETFANAGLNTARTAADDSHANTPAPVNSVVEVRVPHEVQVSTSVTSTTADPEDAQQTQVGGAATLANGNHSAAVNSLRPTNVTSAETAQSKTSVQSSAHQEHSKSPSASVAVHPPAPSPSTQESFFKSINKRLQALESNASLSLQYIEEQSRILRDAFTKVEKRQLNKTETFLTHLNSTVMAELRTFRSQYDQLWQSTVIELETHREQNQREILAISSRLSLLADELVFQKRMAVVQSTLLLMCLGFVLFVGTGGSNLELPIMQSVMNRGQKLRMVVPFETPPLSPHRPGSPDSGAQAERRPGFSRFFKGARARARGSPAHADQPIVEVSAPTPASGSPEAVRSRMRNEIVDSQSESERSVGQIRPRRTEDDSSDVESSRSSGSSSSGNIKQVRPRPRRVRSGPATPQGTRDNPLDWEPAPSTLADGSPESSPPVEETSDPQHESGHGQVHPSAKQSGVDGIGG